MGSVGSRRSRGYACIYLGGVAISDTFSDRRRTHYYLIPLTRGHVAKVSAEDYERLSAHKWCALVQPGRVYAISRIGGRIVRMHRFIMGYGHGKEDPRNVDHKDHDGLNNTRENLRPCNQSQNTANAQLRADNTSGYRGVYFQKTAQKWQAGVRHLGVYHYIGLFADPEQAKVARDNLARELFGEYAST